VAQHWLLKTEPSTYAFEDLVRERRTVWDGVSNALALKHIRAIRNGDTVMVYHTGDVKAVIGLGRVTSDPYADPKVKDGKRVVFDLVPDRALPRPVTLAEMRGEAALAGFDLLRLSRLSVVPVSAAHWKHILALSRA
jgi:predicted RNA-binding protein with PUA-like domain